MNSSSLRNENSVQMSLKQLRDLHTMRVENDIAIARKKREEAAAQAAELEQRRLDEIRAAEEQRLAAERERERERLAAEHELEVAKERARAEAEARVLERQLELQLRQTDAEILKVQASRPKRRGLALIAMAALLGLGGFTWYMQKQADRRLEQVNSTLTATQSESQHADQTIAELKAQLKAAQAAGELDQKQIDDLNSRIEALEKSSQPNKPPVFEPIVPTCVDSPLC